jgi:enoyl-CoA hydratase/carnithine racemase
VASPESRFWINFSRIGFHVGFGISYTLPRIVGTQKAALLMYTGHRVDGTEAAQIGLVDLLVAQDELCDRAVALATEIASASPLAVRAMRRTLRRGLVDEFETAMERELLEQISQRQTADFAEGIRAMAERRTPNFIGR